MRKNLLLSLLSVIGVSLSVCGAGTHKVSTPFVEMIPIETKKMNLKEMQKGSSENRFGKKQCIRKAAEATDKTYTIDFSA